MERDESHRNKWALGLSVTLSVFIFLGWAFYRDFINLNFNNMGVVAQKPAVSQEANVVSATSAPSPLENSKETFRAAFEEIGKRYDALKQSISDVLVPFVTGIEVYERQ